VPDLALEPLLRRLADEFKRRSMNRHLSSLRVFYASHRARKRAAAQHKVPPWDEDTVIEWLALLQISPFENVYQLGCAHGTSFLSSSPAAEGHVRVRGR